MQFFVKHEELGINFKPLAGPELMPTLIEMMSWNRTGARLDIHGDQKLTNHCKYTSYRAFSGAKISQMCSN